MNAMDSSGYPIGLLYIYRTHPMHFADAACCTNTGNGLFILDVGSANNSMDILICLQFIQDIVRVLLINLWSNAINYILVQSRNSKQI